jgi:ABC-type polar amino acid transport system ATPase subunit
VAFEDVSFEFQDNATVLRDLSFVAEPGRRIAIAGATGSGKSALLSLIPRFYDPRSGRVTLDGHDLRRLPLPELRRQVGMVFQENFLFSNTIAANIAFGHPEATQERIERAARIAGAHDFIRALPEGYETFLGEGGVNLSGGQRQRIAIARALLLEPTVLLLDDPTSAIDPETEKEIMEAMEAAMAGRTTFIVAHRLSTLRRADLILVLDRGRLAQVGTHAAAHGGGRPLPTRHPRPIGRSLRMSKPPSRSPSAACGPTKKSRTAFRCAGPPSRGCWPPQQYVHRFWCCSWFSYVLLCSWGRLFTAYQLLLLNIKNDHLFLLVLTLKDSRSWFHRLESHDLVILSL